jgi:hypothetical protein
VGRHARPIYELGRAAEPVNSLTSHGELLERNPNNKPLFAGVSHQRAGFQPIRNTESLRTGCAFVGRVQALLPSSFFASTE